MIETTESYLGDNLTHLDFIEGHEGADDSDEEEEDDTEAIIRAATGGKGLPPATSNYSDIAMNCGDCDFETHYENELFEHLKMHLRKDANLPAETEEEVQQSFYGSYQPIFLFSGKTQERHNRS